MFHQTDLINLIPNFIKVKREYLSGALQQIQSHSDEGGTH